MFLGTWREVYESNQPYRVHLLTVVVDIYYTIFKGHVILRSIYLLSLWRTLF